MNPYSERLAEQAAVLARAGQPGWVSELRGAALEQFRLTGLPGRRVERWKYTSLQALEARAPDLQGDAPERAGPMPAPLLPQAPHVLMLDGCWAGMQGALPPGVRLESLDTALVAADTTELQELLGSLQAADPAAGFTALNSATLHNGAVLRVAAGVDAGAILLQWAVSPTAADHMANSRVCVLLEPGARLDLVEQFEAADQQAWQLNLVLQVSLGAGAILRHARLQQSGQQGILITRTDVGHAADAGYHYTGLDFGGALVRHDLRSRLQAEGAWCQLHGACLTRGDNHVDSHLDVEHLAPGCNSQQWFRAVLGGSSRVVFNGRVLVAPGADGTEARQSSAGLLLSPRAELDSKPELEIYADEVVASHGATVGQLDEDQLFYLQSRGIDRNEARNLLTLAFCRSVIEQAPTASLREALEARLQAGLAAAGIGHD